MKCYMPIIETRVANIGLPYFAGSPNKHHHKMTHHESVFQHLEFYKVHVLLNEIVIFWMSYILM